MILGYLMYVLGEFCQIHGTSASAPVLASMIARINEACLHTGKDPVGFINPVLYGRAGEFVRDVTTGFNARSVSLKHIVLHKNGMLQLG